MKNIITFIKFALVIFINYSLFTNPSFTKMSAIGVMTIIVSIIIQKNTQRQVKFIPLIILGLSLLLFYLIFNTGYPLLYRLQLGLYSTLKITTLSLSVLCFTYSTSIRDILNFLSFLPKDVKLLIAITFSQIPVTLDETDKIISVQKSRGQNFKGLNIFKGIISVIIPLLHRNLKKADQLSIIIVARGYQNE